MKNQDSGTWKEKVIAVDDAIFENRGEKQADIIIQSTGKDNAVFHLVEVTKL